MDIPKMDIPKMDIPKMDIPKKDRDKYGIIYSSDDLVDRMLDMIPEKYYKDKENKWLDVGAGTGQFTSKLLNRLTRYLSPEFDSETHCRNYILQKMIWMCEIYSPHVEILRQKFGEEANIITNDFLTFNIYEYGKFDVVLGNPPFQSNGAIKTPAHKDKDKKEDGKSVYVDFTKRAFEVAQEYGVVCLVIPSLWLKPDKAGLYNFLTEKNILKLNCLSTAESGKLFNNEAQVACTCFLIENCESLSKRINVYDKIINDYSKFELRDNNAIPTNGVSIINKLLKYVDQVGSIKYYKTNTPPKKIKVEAEIGDKFEKNLYKNIKTCYLENDEPKLVINYTNAKLNNANMNTNAKLNNANMNTNAKLNVNTNTKAKLILAHKRLGMPYLDKKGEYGISTRDNYVICDYSLDELVEIQYFLSTKFIIFIFMCFNYRMSFLERYAFNYIPIITNIANFPKLSQKGDKDKRNEIIMNYFGLTEDEKKYVLKSVRDYKFFV